MIAITNFNVHAAGRRTEFCSATRHSGLHLEWSRFPKHALRCCQVFEHHTCVRCIIQTALNAMTKCRTQAWNYATQNTMWNHMTINKPPHMKRRRGGGNAATNCMKRTHMTMVATMTEMHAFSMQTKAACMLTSPIFKCTSSNMIST